MLRKYSSSIQYANTDCDSCEEKDFDFSTCKTNPLKHKTQLCKTFSQLGFCNYGQKCRFAHGRDELIQMPKNYSLKMRKCNNYWGKFHCNYGIRCQFGHSQKCSAQDKLILQVYLAAFSAEDEGNNIEKKSKLLTQILN